MGRTAGRTVVIVALGIIFEAVLWRVPTWLSGLRGWELKSQCKSVRVGMSKPDTVALVTTYDAISFGERPIPELHFYTADVKCSIQFDERTAAVSHVESGKKVPWFRRP